LGWVEKVKMEINASLHCHGAWTDFASGKYDIERFPRNIENLADVGIAKKLNLVALTDISGKHVCEIYRPLVDRKGDRYWIRPGETCTILTRKKDEKQIVFARSLEVLSNEAHALVIGTSANIFGARPLNEIVEETYSVGGKIIADHPCYTIKFGRGMGEKRVRELYSKGRLLALEENANIADFLELIGNYNYKARMLGKKLNIPVVANCDGNTAQDMGKMFTTYTLENDIPIEFWYKAIINLIGCSGYYDSAITRKGEPKKFISLPLHFLRGMYSIYRAKKGWIEKGLPAC